MSPTNRDDDSGEFRLDPSADRRSATPLAEAADTSSPEEALADHRELRFALAAAEHPEDLSDGEHLALLESILGVSMDEAPNLDAPTWIAEEAVDDEQRHEAQRLARALDGLEHHPLAELAFELREAHSPEPLSPLAAERALSRLAANPAGMALVHRRSHPSGASQRSRTTWIWMTGTALALAAGWAVLFRSGAEPAPRSTTSPPPFAVSRSAEPLLQATHWQEGTTERIDRIALARSRDLRQNRYLRWRVR
jgi:hypothetical protein